MSSFATIEAQVEALYVGYFMRAGDPGGTQYWINQIPDTLNIAQAAASFSVQLESAADYPFLATGNLGAPVTELGVSTYTNVYNFINQVYQDLFNRNVDAGGLFYWSAQLVGNIGNPLAIGDFIMNVISGAATGGADDLTLQAKVAVATYITNSAFSAGLTWNSALQTESEILLAATTNAAGSVATEEAAWFSYISNSLPPTFTLTTGVDAPGTGAFATSSITGNNNIVYGTFNGAGATYTTGDDIVAPVGSTGNTLTLTDLGTGGVGNVNSVGATVSNMSILNVNSAEAITANTATGSAGFSGLTALNLNSVDNAANADTITAAITTNVSVTDAASGASGILTINGGLAVILSETNTDAGNAVLLSPISVGGTTAAAGAVTVTATETVSNAASAPANITINGTAGVTVNSTVNDGVALAVSTGTETAAKAATIAVTAGSGAVVINDALNITSTTTIATNADAVSVSGGTTVTVNETVSTTQSATAVSSITEGVVTINGGASTTSVTVDQAAVATGAVVSSGSAAVAQVLAVAGETAQPGISAITAVTAVAPALAVAAVTVGTPTVTADGAVTITDKNHATTTTASNSITSVTLSNFSAGALITDNALSNLSLSGTGGGIAITNVATGAGLTNTTLNVSVSGLSSTTITDTNNEITTLNIATAGATSTLAAINDSHLTTMNVSGTGVVALTAVPSTISTLTVTGSAGFTGDISGTAVTAFDPTSSGVIAATLKDTTQAFTGSTGQDIITISAAATKAIAGGSATNNEMILNGNEATFTAASMANVTNFTTLGVEGNTSGTAEVYNMSSVFKGFNALDVISAVGGAGSDAFTNVVSGTSLTLEGAVAGTGNVAAVEGSIAASLLYQVANTTGPSDSVNVTLGNASTVAAIADGVLMFEDANAVGIGTLNISTVVSAAATSILTDTIGTVIDNGLANLNVSGAAGLTVTTLDEATTQAIALSVDNTSAGVVTIGTFTDANLGSLTIAGTNIVDITTLNDSGHVLSVANNSSYLSQIVSLVDASLTNLSFTGTGAIDVGVLTHVCGGGHLSQYRHGRSDSWRWCGNRHCRRQPDFIDIDRQRRGWFGYRHRRCPECRDGDRRNHWRDDFGHHRQCARQYQSDRRGGYGHRHDHSWQWQRLYHRWFDSGHREHYGGNGIRPDRSAYRLRVDLFGRCGVGRPYRSGRH